MDECMQISVLPPYRLLASNICFFPVYDVYEMYVALRWTSVPCLEQGHPMLSDSTCSSQREVALCIKFKKIKYSVIYVFIVFAVVDRLQRQHWLSKASFPAPAVKRCGVESDSIT